MKVLRTCNLIYGLSALLLALSLAGCAGKSPSVAYYSLGSMEQNASAAAMVTDLDIALGIGPVTVPDSLKRAQIVTHYGGNRYQYDDSHRWSGMIEKDIASVLGNNLGLLLGTDKIAFFPWMHYFAPDYRLMVEIIRFDSKLSGDAVLSARWTVTDSSAEKTLANGKSVHRHALANPSYEALVDAESMVLAKFSQELAGELQKLILKD